MTRPRRPSRFSGRGEILAAFLFGLSATSCAHARAPGAAPEESMVVADEKDSHCARVGISKTGPYDMPLAGPVTDPESMAYLAGFPREARRTAQAGGLEPLLVALLRERERSGGAPTLALLAVQNELVTRLEAFQT